MNSFRHVPCFFIALGLLGGCGGQGDETPIDSQLETLDRARAVEDQLLERAERLGGEADAAEDGEDSDDR